MWFFPAATQRAATHTAFGPAYTYPRIEERELDPFGKFERIEWAVLAIVSSRIVWLSDQLVLATSIWLVGIVILGQFILPPIFRSLHDYINENDRFWVSVICGWALVAGLPVGVFFGVFIPYIHDCGVSSIAGGIVGLFAGPICAAMQGLTITSIVNGIVRLVTGKSLAQNAA